MSLRRWGPAPAVALSAVLAAAALSLSGCGGAPKHVEPSETLGGPPDAVPRVEPRAKYGNMSTYRVFGKTYYTKVSSRNHVERGIASWYGPKFHGRKTSSGERYDMYQMTAAHKTLPLPTYALVRNLENGRSAIVKINDRGPFVGDRIIDLSYAAAKKLGVDRKGTAHVEVVSIDPRDHGGKVPEHRLAAAERRGLGAAASERTAQRRIASAVPAAGPQPVAATSTLPENGTSTASDVKPAMYLQVGAFGTRQNAEQLRRRLASLVGDPVRVREAAYDPKLGGPTLYRVQLGPVASRSDAADLARRLSSLGIARPMVVSD
ncbi:MAG: septal ring lytic transglycosylase RlpA family protein [Chromatiales bacterium]